MMVGEVSFRQYQPTKGAPIAFMIMLPSKVEAKPSIIVSELSTIYGEGIVTI